MIERERRKIRKDPLWWNDLKEVLGSEGWGRNFEDASFGRLGTGRIFVFGRIIGQDVVF